MSQAAMMRGMIFLLLTTSTIALVASERKDGSFTDLFETLGCEAAGLSPLDCMDSSTPPSTPRPPTTDVTPGPPEGASRPASTTERPSKATEIAVTLPPVSLHSPAKQRNLRAADEQRSRFGATSVQKTASAPVSTLKVQVGAAWKPAEWLNKYQAATDSPATSEIQNDPRKDINNNDINDLIDQLKLQLETLKSDNKKLKEDQDNLQNENEDLKLKNQNFDVNLKAQLADYNQVGDKLNKCQGNLKVTQDKLGLCEATSIIYQRRVLDLEADQGRRKGDLEACTMTSDHARAELRMCEALRAAADEEVKKCSSTESLLNNCVEERRCWEDQFAARRMRYSHGHDHGHGHRGHHGPGHHGPGHHGPGHHGPGHQGHHDRREGESKQCSGA